MDRRTPIHQLTSDEKQFPHYVGALLAAVAITGALSSCGGSGSQASVPSTPVASPTALGTPNLNLSPGTSGAPGVTPTVPVGGMSTVPTSLPTGLRPASAYIAVPVISANAAQQGVPTASSLRIQRTGASDIIIDISAASAACTQIGSARFCAVPDATFATTQNYVTTIYDAANGTGDILAQSASSSAGSTAALIPKLAISLANVPVSVGFDIRIDQATGGITGLATPVQPTFYDAGGNAIPAGQAFLTPFGTPQSVTISTDDASQKTTLSQSVFSGAPATPMTLFETARRTNAIHLAASDSVATLALRGSAVLPVVTASTNYSYLLGAEHTVPNSIPAGMDNFRQYFPDAHFSVVPEPVGGYQMIWGIGETWRSTGPTGYPQDQGAATRVWNPYGSTGALQYMNNGTWLLSAYRLDTNRLIGYFHAENGNDPLAYEKTTGVVFSNDDGNSWTNPAEIWRPRVVPQPSPGQTAPPNPGTVGIGDSLVIRDFFNDRWFGMGPEISVDHSGTFVEYGVMAAQSRDPLAAPGTWFKQYNGSYTEPGIGGRATFLPFQGFTANPSIVWNTYLGEWVMVAQGARFFLTTSRTLDDWTAPTQVLIPPNGGSHASYPTLMGVDDKVGGRAMTLYYAYFDPNGDRTFCYRTITFTRND